MVSHPSDDNVQIIPFCLPLPLHSSPSSPIDASASGEISSFGVVGTITIRGHSAVVWFGWGTIEACDDGGSNSISRSNIENGMISIGCGENYSLFHDDGISLFCFKCIFSDYLPISENFLSPSRRIP